MYVEFKRRVVALLRVVEMNEEEDVGPDVMFMVDVMIKALQHRHRVADTSHTHIQIDSTDCQRHQRRQPMSRQ